jgi:hypothetical protein
VGTRLAEAASANGCSASDAGIDDMTETTDRALLARIRAEYDEMPGMRLTVAQAARLFNLDPGRCAHVLHALVSDGALWTNGHVFVGPGVGRGCV